MARVISLFIVDRVFNAPTRYHRRSRPLDGINVRTRQNLLVCVVGALLFAGGAGLLPAQESEPRSRLSLNTRIGFNIRASFSGLGGLPAQSDPGPATGGVDHFYDDGFNRVDSSGNNGGQTWFWGYQSGSQLPGNDTIVMSSSSAAPGRISDVNDDPQYGAELSWFYPLDDDGAYRWGIEGAAGLVRLRFHERGSLAGDVTRVEDVYALNGTIPPAPPYAGTFAGPGPVIGDTPTRTIATLPGAALTAGRYGLDADAYTVRLGLRYESPFNDRIALHFGAGFSGAFVDSEFTFQETTIVSGGAPILRSGTQSETGFLAGGYAGAGLTFQVTGRLAIFAGAQYERLSGFDQRIGGKKARLDLEDAIFVTVGAGFEL